MNRFFLPIEVKHKDQIIITDQNIIRQITLVLRLQVNDNIICLFNDGQEYEVSLKTLTKKNIVADITKIKANMNELNFELILWQALPKSKEKWELILQKATELGVKTIVPLITQHSLAKYPYQSDRIDKIILEASEQSARGFLPQIKPAINLRLSNWQNCLKTKSLNLDQLKNIFPDYIDLLTFNLNHYAFIGDLQNKDSLNLLTKIEQMKIRSTKIAQVSLFIGPEGDFTLAEINLFKALGANSISLGSRILRMETATITALGVLGLL